MEKKVTDYSLEKEVRKEIQKKITELLELCQIYKVPMYVSVAIENNESETKYKNTMYSAKVHDIRLRDDQIEKHILISNGFCAVPKRETVEIDMDLLAGGCNQKEKEEENG